MKLENQVCSLELAKELKRLGVKQDSLWYWVFDTDMELATYKVPFLSARKTNHVDKCLIGSAFTVAELGELLPQHWKGKAGFMLTCVKDVGAWWIGYVDDDFCQEDISLQRKTEANVRARMLIYLIKRGMVKV